MISCPTVSVNKKRCSPPILAIFFALMTQSLPKLLSIVFQSEFCNLHHYLCPARIRLQYAWKRMTLRPWGHQPFSDTHCTPGTEHSTTLHSPQLNNIRSWETFFFRTCKYDGRKLEIARGPLSSINEDLIEKDYSDIVMCAGKIFYVFRRIGPLICFIFHQFLGFLNCHQFARTEKRKAFFIRLIDDPMITNGASKTCTDLRNNGFMFDSQTIKSAL